MEDNGSTPMDAAHESADGTSGGAMVRTALLSAAGVAVGATLTESAQAQEPGRAGGHIRIIVQEGAIETATLRQVIRRVIAQLNPGGCRTCGLVGFDLSILRGDPPFLTGGPGGVIEAFETVR